MVHNAVTLLGFTTLIQGWSKIQGTPRGKTQHPSVGNIANLWAKAEEGNSIQLPMLQNRKEGRKGVTEILYFLMILISCVIADWEKQAK